MSGKFIMLVAAAAALAAHAQVIADVDGHYPNEPTWAALGGPAQELPADGAEPSRKATNPVPADGGQAEVLPLLQWTPGFGAVFHNVYLATSQRFAPSHLIASYLPTPFYQVSEELTPGVTYYWRVDEVEEDMVTTQRGKVWSFTANRHSGEALDPHLVGWWKLDGLDSSLVVDSSGWENHGIAQGNPQRVKGHLGNALSFDGLDDGVNCGYSSSLMQVDSVSVTAWIKLAALGGDSKVAGNHDGVIGGYKLGIYYDDKIEFEIRDVGNIPVLNRGLPGGTILAQDVWYHVAGVYDKGRSIRTYVNGKLDRELQTAAVVGISRGPFLLGHELCCGVHRWVGLLDDIRVYNGALTVEEIDRVMRGEELFASNPWPASGANVDIHDVNVLSWLAGDGALMHDVYFGTDEDAVRAADVTSPLYRGRRADPNFPLDGLIEAGNWYFWRVDEVPDDGATIYKGSVWTFTAFDYFVAIDDFESYTLNEGSRLSETWVDGRSNSTGSQMSLLSKSPAQPTGAHGKQFMSLAYDNARPPFVSEVEREFAPEQDWTAGAANTLSLWLRGDVVSFGETAPGIYAMSATGADIGIAGDEFRYAYRRLDGDGAIVARVGYLVQSHSWAKAGVMIRESLDRASAHASMFVTPDGRRAFQNRPINGSGICLTAHSYPWAVTLPHWVKIERRGDQFTGYHSVDGVNWIQQPDEEDVVLRQSPHPQTIYMPTYVYVGLALTSHADGVVATAEFSGVETTGDVMGEWHVAEIGVDHPGNSPDDVYVVVEDSDGKTAVVIDPDPMAVNATAWTEWKIPLSDFLDVDLGRVKKMSIGVGGRETALPPGTGSIHIDDIRVQSQ